jgi:hypothetical protein
VRASCSFSWDSDFPAIAGEAPTATATSRRQRKGSQSLKNALIAAIVAAVVAAASGTAATIFVTSKNIKNGTIQTVDISAKAKRALKGRRGPRGRQGIQGIEGIQGDKGDKGDTGPSNVYGASLCTTGIPGCPASSPPPKELTASTFAETDFFVTVNIPAGAYSAHATVTIVAPPDGDLDPDNDPDWRVECMLRAPLTGPGYAGGATATVGAYGGDASETTLPIVFAGNLPNGGPLGLKCRRGAGSGAAGTGSSNPKVVYVEVSAIRVGSLG